MPAKRAKKDCSVAGCERPSRTKGLCEGHYGRHLRGAPLDATPLKGRPEQHSNQGKMCSVDGCERPATAKGLCPGHYYRNRTKVPADAPLRRQGESSHPLYHTWANMIARCHRPKDRHYPRWGGRGIVVCDRWRQSFFWFVEDVGERPPGHTLDRIENDGPYAPGNCKWATPAEQNRNRRNTRVTVDQAGKILDLSRSGLSRGEVAAAVGVRYEDVIRTVAPHLEPKPEAKPKPAWTGEPVRRGRKPMDRRCSVDDCDGKHYAASFCRKHWNHKIGYPGLEERLANRRCPQCDAPIPATAHPTKKFCCHSHQMKWQRAKGCYTAEAIIENRGTCGLEGCEQPVHAQGYCRSHYMRMWRHGDPEHVQPPKAARTCSEPGCDGKYAARGFCFKHYHERRSRGEFSSPATVRSVAGNGIGSSP